MLPRALHIINDISILSMVLRFRQYLFLYLFYMDSSSHRSLLSPWRDISLILRHYGGHVWHPRACYYCRPGHLTGHIHGLSTVSISVGFLISSIFLRIHTISNANLATILSYFWFDRSPFAISFTIGFVATYENTKKPQKHHTLTLRVPSPSIRTHTSFSSSAVLEHHLFCSPW